MIAFWQSFEKRAASLLGSMPGVTSGIRQFSRGGRIRTARPVSGQVIGPRSTPAPIPGPKPIHGADAVKGALPGANVAKATIPKPPKQVGRGVSSTYL